MRPFSFTAQALRVIWDGVPLLVWLGLCYFFYRRIGLLLSTPMELTLPFAAAAVAVLMWLLRPVRKRFNITAYRLMVLSPIRPLVELGIWELLLVNEKYYSNELPRYEGMAAFAASFHRRKPKWQMKINRILWRADAVGRPHLAKPSREFLRQVNAPLREDWKG